MKTLLGYYIFQRGIEECNQQIRNILTGEKRHAKWLACINPHSYVQAKGKQEFSSALQKADWLVPDGVGITIAAKFLGYSIEERVTGYDVFLGVMSELNRHSGRVYFLGSSTKVLEQIEKRVMQDYPSIVLAGSYSPPFEPVFSIENINTMVNEVVSSNADVLWVGLSAPKQELWLAQNTDKLNVRFAGAIGAVFDFYSGNVTRSGPVFRRFGLEWLPRLIQEPTRLWPRVFISGPKFILDVLREKIK